MEAAICWALQEIPSVAIVATQLRKSSQQSAVSRGQGQVC